MSHALLKALCGAAVLASAFVIPAAMAQQMSPGYQATPALPSEPPKPARLPDGTLNITGFWTSAWGLLDVNRGPGGVTPLKEEPRPHGVVENVAPLKSPYREQYGKFMQDVAKGIVADKSAICYPQGFPRMMIAVYGMEILQTPGQIAITSEYGPASRRIWLNQKAHTPADELDPSYYGESIGHWEGDTLVVDTIGIREDVPLDFLGLPHSSKLHVIEKFSFTKPGVITVATTIDDPDAFEKSWTMEKEYRYRPELHISEYVCQENNRDVGANGEAVFQNR